MFIFKQARYFIVVFLLLLNSIQSAQAAPAVAGQVVLVTGQLQAQHNTAARILKRGTWFFATDTLTTAAASTAQLRFTDGTLIALRPATQFRVDTYQATAAQLTQHDTTVKYAVSLLKGGLRSISGKIAKLNPAQYTITTNVATIGVRGTEFSLMLDADGGLGAATYKGLIYLQNAGGRIEIGDGAEYGYAYVATARQKPVGRPILPTFMLNDPRIVKIQNINARVNEHVGVQRNVCIS